VIVARLVVAAVVGLGAAGCAGERARSPSGAGALGDASMPGPAAGRGLAAVRRNAACERCHEVEAREWRGSLHHLADTDRAYRESFALEPLPFCRGCHAPEADPDREEAPAVAALGVGCVTCHETREGEVLAAASSEPSASPHPVRRSARFGGDAACASCHEFAFPGRSLGPAMQSTVSEHRASPRADTPCAGCHMPRAPSGRRNHAFAASRDEGSLRGATRVEARRTSARRVTISLSPVALGHDFPTGDLFRRIVVSVAPSGQGRGGAERVLGRRFRLDATGDGKVASGDDRVNAGAPKLVEVELGEEAIGRPVEWSVTYERVAHPEGLDGGAAEVEARTVLAHGELPP
jgi:hypothetical protein